jgi:hypothetical protein
MSQRQQLETSLEAAGLSNLRQALQLTGQIVRFSGETFTDFCARIAAEYFISVAAAKEQLQKFQ